MSQGWHRLYRACYTSPMTQNEAPAPLTDTQAHDEATLLLVRKVLRMAPAIMDKMPTEAVEALLEAERRADQRRTADERDGVAIGSRPWPIRDDLDD